MHLSVLIFFFSHKIMFKGKKRKCRSGLPVIKLCVLLNIFSLILIKRGCNLTVFQFPLHWNHRTSFKLSRYCLWKCLFLQCAQFITFSFRETLEETSASMKKGHSLACCNPKLIRPLIPQTGLQGVQTISATGDICPCHRMSFHWMSSSTAHGCTRRQTGRHPLSGLSSNPQLNLSLQLMYLGRETQKNKCWH